MAEVAVSMITYNHEQYIEQAVRSALSQIGPHDVRVVVSDDASTDSTPDILRRLRREFGDRLRPALRERNVGAMANYLATLAASEGDYVAILEGDDYWTDPAKVAKQVALLESNPDMSGCYGRAEVVSDRSAQQGPKYIPSDDPTRARLSLSDVLRKNGIATCTVMYRQRVLRSDLSGLHKLSQGDWPLQMHAAMLGPIGYMNDVLGAYRQHDGGLWTSLGEARRAAETARAAAYGMGIVPRDYQAIAARTAAKRALEAAHLFGQLGDRAAGLTWSCRGLAWLSGRHLWANKGLAARLALLMVAPSLSARRLQ
jgi:glycosyltransferase involved in cell wall biosynthesis